MRILVVSLIVIVADQLTKFIVSTTMDLGQSIPIINNFLYFTYIRNPGAAFGILPHQTLFLVLVTVLVVALILYYFKVLSPKYKYVRLGLSMQMGGAIGNLIDRVRDDSHVIDFINFTIFPPIFNLADMAIVIGIIIFLVSFWYTEKKESEENN